MVTGDEIAIRADNKSRTYNSLIIRLEDFYHRFSEAIDIVMIHGNETISGSTKIWVFPRHPPGN
jgi:hypothetical protein